VTHPVGPAVARVERADGGPVESLPVLYFAANAVLGEREGIVVPDAPTKTPAAPTK
jgi:hypothetical protein